MNGKRIILPFLIFLSGFLSVGIWSKTLEASGVPTEQTSNVSNWKTYSNEIGGYSISYPSNWTVQEFGTNANFAPDSSQLPLGPTMGYAPISMEVRERAISDWSGLNTFQQKEINLPLISNLSAKRYKGIYSSSSLSCVGISLDEVEVRNGKLFFYLTYLNGKGDYQKIFNDMVLTFKQI